MIAFLDRFIAAVCLALSFPAMLMSACVIKLSSRGTVLHCAQRAGRGGHPFTMYKLRTMHERQEGFGRITSRRDPRIFPAGAVLRRLKLDEVPQLLNVLRGDMSLVGPRPEDVTIVHEYYDAFMWESLTVPPGMTSPGSLGYFANETVLPADPDEAEAVYLDVLLPRKIALDLVFVRNRSVAYYMEILVRTAFGIAGIGSVWRRREESEAKEAERIMAARECINVS